MLLPYVTDWLAVHQWPCRKERRMKQMSSTHSLVDNLIKTLFLQRVTHLVARFSHVPHIKKSIKNPHL